jgi:hypothetical protein
MIEAYVGLSLVAQQTQDWQTAAELGKTVLQLRRDAGQHKMLFPTLTFIADIAIESGEISSARQRLKEALALSKDSHGGMRLYFLMIAAKLLLQTDHPLQASQFLNLIHAHAAKQKWVAYGSDHLDLESRDLQVLSNSCNYPAAPPRRIRLSPSVTAC